MAKREPIDGANRAGERGLRVVHDRFAALFRRLAEPATRRYTIEVRDAESGAVVMFGAVDWTSAQKGEGLAQIRRAAGLPVDDEFTETGKR